MKGRWSSELSGKAAGLGIVTCPSCGHKTSMPIPAGRCMAFYTCPSCKKLINAKKSCKYINSKPAPLPLMFHKPKGTTDYYPEEFARLSSILNTFRCVAARYGYREVESPAFEELKLLSEKEGEEIKEQIFVLEKRGEEAFGLRFDLTVPLARMFIAIQKSTQKPVKWCYGTRMWRYERPQKGRSREFYQFGVELFGSERPDADAEVINLAIDCLKALGLTSKEVFVNINNRKLLQGLLCDLVPESFLMEAIAIIDKREKIEEEEFFSLLKSVHVKDPSRLIELLDLADLTSISKLPMNPMARKGFEELKAIMTIVDPDYCRISLSTVRGLSYYTSTVFEIFDVASKYRSVCGGGRYDNLISLFGGEATPAVGFGMGMETLSLVLDDCKKTPPDTQAIDTYIAIVDDSVRDTARRIAQSLRTTKRVDMDLIGRSLSKQLAYASSLGATEAVIVGPTDVSKGSVTVRNLLTGKESTVLITAITNQAGASSRNQAAAAQRSVSAARRRHGSKKH